LEVEGNREQRSRVRRRGRRGGRARRDAGAGAQRGVHARWRWWILQWSRLRPLELQLEPLVELEPWRQQRRRRGTAQRRLLVGLGALAAPLVQQRARRRPLPRRRLLRRLLGWVLPLVRLRLGSLLRLRLRLGL